MVSMGPESKYSLAGSCDSGFLTRWKSRCWIVLWSHRKACLKTALPWRLWTETFSIPCHVGFFMKELTTWQWVRRRGWPKWKSKSLHDLIIEVIPVLLDSLRWKGVTGSSPCSWQRTRQGIGTRRWDVRANLVLHTILGEERPLISGSPHLPRLAIPSLLLLLQLVGSQFDVL